MVRRKVQIKAIQDKSKRHTTFTKRRHGLFKKAQDLCDLCGGEVAVIAFSKAGNAFGFGHPSVEDVVWRYHAHPASSLATGDADDDVEEPVNGARSGVEKEEEAPPLTEMEKRIGEAMANERPSWDATVKNLGLSELDELEAAIQKVKIEVATLAREAATAGEGNTPHLTAGV